MQRLTGRERRWDIELNGYYFPVLRDKNDNPVWSVDEAPDVIGQTTGIQDVERPYRSTHSGYGWGQYSAPNTCHYALDMDTRFPNQVIMGPLVTTITPESTDSTNGVLGFFEYGTTYIYALCGRYCNRITLSNDSVAAAGGFPHDFGAGTVASQGIRFDDYVLIGFSSTATELVKFDGSSTFTADNDSLQGAYFAKWSSDEVVSLAQTFLSGSNPAVAWLATTADPLDPAQWTGAAGGYPIGDSSSAMTGLAAVDVTMFPAKTDGLYYIDGRSGLAKLLVPAMPVDASNGKNTIADSQARIWYPTKSGLYMYDSASGENPDVSPGRGLPDRSGITGLKTAIAHFRSWTFVSIYDGTDSYVMAGRQREEGEPGYGPYIWHGALVKISGTKITSMHVSSATSPPRLWMGLLSGSIAYIRLPANGDNPLADTTYRYAASGSLYYGADDYGSGGMRWNLQDVIIETEGVDANTTVAVYERRDRNSGTAQVETATVLGTIGASGAGNATVIVTAANMTGAPKTVSVAVANNDTASQVGGKIRTALAADTTVGAFFSVSGSGANVVLAVKNVVANDATMNISIDNGTCTGLTAAPTSTNTTAGVDGWALLQTIASSGRTVISTTGDKRFQRCELRLDVTNAVSTATPVIRALVGKASRRPTLKDVITTTVLCSDSAISRLGEANRYTANDLVTQLKAMAEYYPVTLKHWWTGSETSQTVLVMPIHQRVVRQGDNKAAELAIDLVMKAVD